MHLLVPGRDVLNRRDDRLQLFLRFLELLRKFYDLLERGQLLLRLPRVVEGLNQFLRLRHALVAQLDRIGLFRWNRKRAARFHLFARGFPPLFPFYFGKQIGDHPIADLLGGRVPLEAFQNISDNRRRLVFGQFLRSAEIAGLAREKMFWRNDSEIVGGVLQLHGVTLFAWEIDQDLVKQEVPLGDPAKSPALVQAKGAGLERVQFFGRFRCQFARFDKFLELSVHESEQTTMNARAGKQAA